MRECYGSVIASPILSILPYLCTCQPDRTTLLAEDFGNRVPALRAHKPCNCTMMTYMPSKVDSALLRKMETIKHLVGNTPLFPVTRIFNKKNVRIYAKMEWRQFGGSIKSRPAFNIIKQAILRGDLREGMTILDASSGNTGIAYAHICAALGLKLKLCLPEEATIERKRILTMFGVDLMYSPGKKTSKSQEIVKEIYAKNPEKYFYADQYSNKDNWVAHYMTAEEILQQTNQEVTHFCSSLGTTGTFVGTGRRLKEFDPNIQLVSLQPDSPDHKLEGWKHLATATVPSIYDPNLADSTRFVNTADAYDMITRFSKEEGLLISPSSAANMVGAIRLAEEIDQGVIVTVFTDNAAKYSAVIGGLAGI